MLAEGPGMNQQPWLALLQGMLLHLQLLNARIDDVTQGECLGD